MKTKFWLIYLILLILTFCVVITGCSVIYKSRTAVDSSSTIGKTNETGISNSTSVLETITPTQSSSSSSGPTNSPTSSPTNSPTSIPTISPNIDPFEQVSELIKIYEIGLVEAINENDFSIAEPFLLPESSLYKSQEKLVEDLYTKGIKEQYISHEFGYIYYETAYVYKAEVVETISIDYPVKGTLVKEFQWIYTATDIDGTMKLSEIKKWDTFEKDIEMMMGSVKADGYYADELLYEHFDEALVTALNKDNVVDFEEHLEVDSVIEQYNNFLTNLNERGHSFELVRSEVLDDNGEIFFNPYLAKKQIDLSYINNDLQEKELTIILELELKEYRLGYGGLFGGYANITDIIVIEVK